MVLIAAIRVAATGKFHGRKMPLKRSYFFDYTTISFLPQTGKLPPFQSFRKRPV